MRKIFLLLGVAFGFTALLHAQHAKPQLAFEKTLYDFGSMPEDKGTVQFTFNFTNTGGQPLVLHQVQASCGCTSPEWTRNPVPPGGKGTVKVTFDPKNRPGNFNKSITISSNAQNASLVLRITGNVQAKAMTTQDIYPYEMGSIRLADTHLAMTKVAPGTVKKEQLKWFNTSNKEVTLSFFNVPAHLSIQSIPAVVKPGQPALIVAEYDANKKNDWGFVVDQVFVSFDGEKDYKNRITVSASIEEDFTKLNEESLLNAPVILIEEKNFDFGDIKPTQKVEHSYVVKNTGKSNLVIHKVKASCGCTAIQPKKMMLTPGESTEIVTVFDPTGKSGRQNKSVTVISNDPVNTNVLLRISGNILPE